MRVFDTSRFNDPPRERLHVLAVVEDATTQSLAGVETLRMMSDLGDPVFVTTISHSVPPQRGCLGVPLGPTRTTRIASIS